MATSKAPIGVRQIRLLLEKHLRTDAELNAFCMDYFSEVFQRFSSGMDRLEKTNLLLQIVNDDAVILDKLTKFSSIKSQARNAKIKKSTEQIDIDKPLQPNDDAIHEILTVSHYVVKIEIRKEVLHENLKILVSKLLRISIDSIRRICIKEDMLGWISSYAELDIGCQFEIPNLILEAAQSACSGLKGNYIPVHWEIPAIVQDKVLESEIQRKQAGKKIIAKDIDLLSDSLEFLFCRPVKDVTLQELDNYLEAMIDYSSYTYVSRDRLWLPPNENALPRQLLRQCCKNMKLLAATNYLQHVNNIYQSAPEYPSAAFSKALSNEMDIYLESILREYPTLVDSLVLDKSGLSRERRRQLMAQRKQSSQP